MKSFCRKFSEFISTEVGREVQVLFLNCNAHFLLGLSRSCESSLKEFQVNLEEAGRLGRESVPEFSKWKSPNDAGTRLIRMASSLTGPRGNEKCGCRGDWLAYCEQRGVVSQMTNYRDNRFNCYFLAAASVIYHREHIHTLFSGLLGHSNSLIRSVKADLEDNRVLCLVCAIALLYFNITGPFWGLLESKTQYTEQHKFIQHLEQKMTNWQGDSSELLDPQFDGVFPEFKIDSCMRQSVYGFAEANRNCVQEALQFIMKGMLTVLHTQLADFMESGKYGSEQTEEVKMALKHCPLTNLLGENVFGLMDFCMGKARHASLHRHSTLLMLSSNRTAEWIQSKDHDTRAALMKTARAERRQLRQRHQEQAKRVKLKLREQLLENARQQGMKKAKIARRQAAVVRKVAEHGGPCQSAADVRRLVSRLRERERPTGQIRAALLEEVRFQKQVLGVKGALKISGNVEQLVTSLSQHFRERPQVGDELLTDGEEEPQEAADNRMEEDEEPPAAFSFERQGQWVSVVYDDRYYIG